MKGAASEVFGEHFDEALWQRASLPNHLVLVSIIRLSTQNQP